MNPVTEAFIPSEQRKRVRVEGWVHAGWTTYEKRAYDRLEGYVVQFDNGQFVTVSADKCVEIPTRSLPPPTATIIQFPVKVVR